MSKKRSTAQMPASILLCLLASAPTAAQIKPDATLPVNSLVTPQGNIIQIDGGTRAGNNLFHSFNQFSVPTGGTAFFNNALDVGNIFSRVTGSAISNIDGILKANGTANLFLLNPNGIVFGKDAQLNIGGSFLATTANSINFADGTVFNATNPQTAPLLTISVPSGVQFGSNPGTIEVVGTGNTFTHPDPVFGSVIRGSLTGMSVKPGNTLALIGGDINLEGGVVTAPSGRIELGSVSGGLVSLVSAPGGTGWIFDYSRVPAFRDIRLDMRAGVDASGASGGAIAVNGRQVSLQDGSVILIQNLGMSPSGNISVNATESLLVSGTAEDLSMRTAILTEPVAGGAGGNVFISTPQLRVDDGGFVGTITSTAARAGNIIINAPESVQLISTSSLDARFFSSMGSLTFSSGSAGTTSVNTGGLTVLNGATLASATFGTGNSGDVNIFATGTVEIIGSNIEFARPAQVGSTTNSAGNASNLTINTSKLLIQNGGFVGDSTAAEGNAGSVTINATDSIEISGISSDNISPSALYSGGLIRSPAQQQLLRLSPLPSGNSGNVTLNTPRLSVQNGALVSVRNQGTGNAGELIISAGSIFLANGGAITASTASGEGGNIQVQTQDLQLRYNGSISATARGTGNGGNITLNPEILVALENSNITANAFKGSGGNIKINTQGIFRAPDSAITASSQLGVNGLVNINTPGVNPSLGLVTLPAEVVDASRLIAQGCSTANSSTRSRFVVTGSGGLPPNPGETLTSDAVWEDLRSEGSIAKNGSTTTSPANSAPESPLVEATGWEIDERGVVTLTAPATTATIPGLTQKTCHTR